MFPLLSNRHFTFHNVSINTLPYPLFKYLILSLHSTMFLLIQISAEQLLMIIETLHSTMFLLILRKILILKPVYQSLHSTMFLLIQLFKLYPDAIETFFTFHNVSINTLPVQLSFMIYFSLHSTMFLLIR